MEGLFNLNSILLHMLNAAILFAAVYFLLYKPVRKFLKAREDKINAQFAAGEKAEKERDEIVEDGKAKVDEYRRQVEEELAVLSRQSADQSKNIIDGADREAKAIVENARLEAEHIIASTRKNMLEQSASLAAEMAAAILSREFGEEDQRRLVNEFLEKVE